MYSFGAQRGVIKNTENQFYSMRNGVIGRLINPKTLYDVVTNFVDEVTFDLICRCII